MAGDSLLVDRVKETMGGTATIFVKRDEAFVCIATNVLKPDGSRAVGTLLDPEGPASKAMRRGDSFDGVADILTSPVMNQFAARKARRSALSRLASRWNPFPKSARQ
jgi:hypothetical protein